MLPNKFLQRKGPCIYRAIACKALCVQKHCLQRPCWYHGALLAAEFFHTICAGVCRVIKLPLNGGRAVESPLQGHTDFGARSSVLHLARRGVWFR